MSNPIEEALEWYREMVGDCNRHGDPGPAARDKLAKDRGGKAAEALAALRSGEVEVVDGGRLQEVCNELDRHNVSPIIDYDVVTLSEKWLAYLRREEEDNE